MLMDGLLDPTVRKRVLVWELIGLKYFNIFCLILNRSLPAKRTVSMFDSGQDVYSKHRGKRMEKVRSEVICHKSSLRDKLVANDT